jgi:magnesium-transporting ATPase (P-type)
MVGDGANDLMAIKESDIGIGISESDAVYSSSFTVRKLMQIDTIIRESKNTEQQIIEMTQYFSLISVLAIIVTICLTDDYSYFDSIQQIIHNFLISLPLTLFIGLSRPAEKNSKFSPESNFMGVENHLIYWGNVLIIGGGSIIAYYYYVNTDDFVSNPISSVTFDSGWSGESKGSTIFLGITNIYYSFLPILLARSKPWKESYWKNIPLFVLTLLDIIFSVSYFFITSSLSFLNVLPIGLAQASIVFGIMIGTIFIGFLYNLIV